MVFTVSIYLLLIICECTSDQRVTVGDYVQFTLSVYFTNPSAVYLIYAHAFGGRGSGMSGSALSPSSNCIFNNRRCSSTSTSTSITVTIYMSNVQLNEGGFYSLTTDAGTWNWSTVLLTVCEPANRPVLLSSVNNSLHLLQCKINSRCSPPCNDCWSNYTYTWYEKLSLSVTEASIIDGVTSESLSLAVAEPNGRGYYCTTTMAGIGHVSSVNTFWHVCYPNESVTCGLYGQDVSVYFFIDPSLRMNLSDWSRVNIQGVNNVSFDFSLGSSWLAQTVDNVTPIRSEHTCGFVVNNATVRDLGRYVAIISDYETDWSVTLKQTLQLCEEPSSPHITAVLNKGSQVLMCTIVHDSSNCSVPKYYLWLINGTLSASNINRNMTIYRRACYNITYTYNTTYACCVAWKSGVCMAISQPYMATTTVSPDLCQVSPIVGPTRPTGTSNTPAIIQGVTIGSGVLLVAVIAVNVAVVCHRVKGKKNNKPSAPHSNATSQSNPYAGLAIERSNNHPYDLPHEPDYHEISGQSEYATQELNTHPQVLATDKYTHLAATSGEDGRYEQLPAPHSYDNGTDFTDQPLA